MGAEWAGRPIGVQQFAKVVVQRAGILRRYLFNVYILYMAVAGERSVSDARKDLAAVIDAARSTHEPVWLSRHGHRVAAVVSAEELERIQELAEDMQDILDAAEARAEMRGSAEEPVPWEQVKADLGLS